MLELAVKTLIAYLLGSLMGALILGAFRGVDIRTQGSGNAGGTNDRPHSVTPQIGQDHSPKAHRFKKVR